MPVAKYRRVLLKLGGESLASPGGYGISPHVAEEIAAKVSSMRDMEVEVVIVLGAGNILRGKDGLVHGMDRATADHMGMLATVMNALAFQEVALPNMLMVKFPRLTLEFRSGVLGPSSGF